jgi:iron uptake system component EfeO
MRSLLSTIAASALVLSACTGSSSSSNAPADAQNVEVGVQEWSVTPAVTTVKAGKITFVAKNRGGVVHELELSNQEGAEIPDSASLGEAEAMDPGQTKSFTVDLKPGTYELACRIKETSATPPFVHYDKGMHTKFTVQ